MTAFSLYFFAIDMAWGLLRPVVCNIRFHVQPIRSAPPGKKYIRCTCRCLLICKATAQRVSCPRSDCGRVLYLAPLPNSFPGYSLPGLCSVSCGYCGQAFMFNTFSNALARCPSCRKVRVKPNNNTGFQNAVFQLL